MTTRNRATLRQFFEEGRQPSSDHFGDLIDSMLNMSDEGFRKTPEHGFEITSDEALMSFYREQNSQDPIWSVGFGGDRNQLLLRAGEGSTNGAPPVLALDLAGRAGIGTAQPQEALDVRGVIASQGRRGTIHRHDTEGQLLLANGEWHKLKGPLQGCQAFEITAGVGLPESGRFALMHAIAMNTYNPVPGWLAWTSRRNGIRCQHAWYGQRCDRLELRWTGDRGRNGKYQLEIRTRCNYEKDCVIQASVTSLWQDEHMKGSDPK
ncbi:hypothetical protein [Roseateles asaccharophilus]|uniref:Uncharacterized protein n=1 Tax=Roseateles asaccharophilus TaxID=582607 RepID=A0ABU2ABK8_9BURK|nr:hypothetical protein [Roseateles asaccharophilus]MDR7334594.1 hypothetical protein [Roseateles asaccharophilus]